MSNLQDRPELKQGHVRQMKHCSCRLHSEQEVCSPKGKLRHAEEREREVPSCPHFLYMGLKISHPMSCTTCGTEER